MTPGLAPLQVFRDVAVVPVQSVVQHVAVGGPIWTDFDQQVTARHCRDRKPVDTCPAAPAQVDALAQTALWGGFLNPQFGHLIVEQLTRLPQSLAERPGDRVLFTLPRGATVSSVPDWVWQALAWHGVSRERAWLVDRPLAAAELRVAAQGEMMGRDVTGEAYLDLLDRNPQRAALVPDPAQVVFVTRAGLVERGQGGHAGESYLADALRLAGVRVVDPARLSVSQQLAIYAGARVLVFSEGSAIHGRLLLGRIAQHIHVLRRRPHRDLAAEQLAPRCDALTYHAAVGRRLGARKPGGVNRLDLTAAIYDLDVVLDLFARLGHDPSRHWDTTAYDAAVARDLTGWLSSCKTDADQHLANLDLIRQAGFQIGTPFKSPLRARAL